MLIKLNIYTLYVNFIKHNLFATYLTYKFYQKENIQLYPLFPCGILLHLKQNNLTYRSTCKNIIGKIFNFNKREYKKEKYEMKGEIKKRKNQM